MTVRRERVTRRRSRVAITVDAKRPGISAVGKVIDGRYVVHELLGRGSSAEVYRVWDPTEQRIVALKRPHRGAELDGWGAAVSRFAHEYYALCQLTHPAIVRVFEYGQDDGVPYYTLELVEGADLAELAPLPVRRVCELMHGLASGLSLLHKRSLIHRDISATNVRLQQESIRLIDFGLMAPMGVVNVVAGTAPFLAPEAVQQQHLDGRVDLFALGALAYFALTGRHAYPAGRIDQLRDQWRSPARQLARLVPDVPPAFAALVMQLIALDRGRRPASAAEVMERLQPWLGPGAAEPSLAAHAHLVSPPLLGREQALIRVRRLVVRAAVGCGSRIVVRGERGCGRSRFLDACVLEGKVSGATVARADGADSEKGEYGVLRSLIVQLLASAPEASARLGQGHGVLRQLLADGAGGRSVSDEKRTAHMVTIRDAMCAWIRALCRDRTVLIAIDDFPRVDAASAAILAALAHEVEVRRMVLVATTTGESGPGAYAGEWLAAVSESLTLQPFTAEQVGQLFAGLFGDGAGVSGLGQRVHALTLGQPRACMLLFRHWVDRELCVYRAGAWTVPASLGVQHLPDDMRQVLRERLSMLSPLARSLLLHLCLFEGMLDLATVVQLPAEQSEPPGAAAAHAALDVLVAGEYVAHSHHRYRVVDPDLRQLLLAATTADELRAAHSRLAHVCEGQAHLSKREVYHRLHGGDEAGAVDAMVRYLRASPIWSEDGLQQNQALLTGVLSAAERLGRPDADMIPLELAMLALSCSLRVGGYREPLGRLARRLTRACGLDLYADQDSAVELEVRVKRALSAAAARFEAEGGAAVTYSPRDALVAASTTVRWAAALAATLADTTLLEGLPDIRAYASLSPLLSLSMCPVEVARLGSLGNYEAAYDVLCHFYSQVEQLSSHGVDPDSASLARNSVLFGKALMAARMGRDGAFEAADELERFPEQQMNAWILRMSAHLRQGDLGAAHRCRLRVELLRTEQRPPQVFDGVSLLLETEHFVSTGDAAGMRALLPRFAQMVEVHPPFARWGNLAQAIYLMLSGDLVGAEAAMHDLIESLAYGAHVVRFHAQRLRLYVLYLLGRDREVLLCAPAYLEEQRAHTGWLLYVESESVWAVSLARQGQGAEAARLLDAAFEHIERHGASWYTCSQLNQRRAQIACLMRDRAGFERHADATVELLRKGSTAAMTLGHDQLLEMAQEVGWTVPARYLLRSHADLAAAEDAERLVEQARALVVAGDSVYQQWLSLLLWRHGCGSGSLWLYEDGVRPSLLAQSGDLGADVVTLGRSLHEHYGGGAMETADDDEMPSTADVATQLVVGQRRFSVCCLATWPESKVPSVVALLSCPGLALTEQWELWGALGSAVVREWRRDCAGITLPGG